MSWVTVLFAMFESGVSLEVVAVLLKIVPLATVAGTFTTSKKTDGAEPEPLIGVLQWTVPVLPTGGVVQLQPAGTSSDWNVVLLGMVSSRTILKAALGPLLATDIL